MRILFVSGDLCDGGAQRVISVIANEMASLGKEVYLLAFYRSPKDYYINDSVHLTYMCDGYEEYSQKNHFERLFYIRRYIKHVRPDVGIGFLQGGYAMYFASIGLRFKKIASLRNAPETIFKGKSVFDIATRFWFNHADAVVLQNNSQLQEVSKYKWKNKCVIPNPISQRVIDSNQVTYREKCTRFVMVGRLTKQKNYYLAINTMKDVIEEYSNIQLDIYGDGELRDELDELIANNRLNNNIRLMGWTTDTIETMKEYDAFMLTSDYEGMPNALMEAMGLGLPCIATDCKTGPRELIQNDVNGFLVNVDDQNELTKKILTVCNMSRDQRKSIGTIARNYIIGKYSLKEIADRWSGLISS